MSQRARESAGGRAAETEETDTLRVLVVDDEPLARDCVRLALLDVPGAEVVGECEDGDRAVEAIGSLHPDVVFLDIQMPGSDGLEVVRRVGAEFMPPVVFVTAFDRYAVQAFDVHALDYVLKPFENRRLVAAVERVRERQREQREGELGRRLAGLLQEWSGRAPSPAPPHESSAPSGGGSHDWVRRFVVRDGHRHHVVPAAEVDWIGAAGNYAVLHVGKKQYRVRLSLAVLAKELDPRRFRQIHRSTIVNLDRVREIQAWFGGDYLVILHDGQQLRVSRTRAQDLLRPTS